MCVFLSLQHLSTGSVVTRAFLLPRVELFSVISCGRSDYVLHWTMCVHLYLELPPLLSLTFDRDVSALFLPIPPALSLTNIMTLILLLYGGDGEIQDPAVGGLLEGEPAVKQVRVEVHAPAVQLLGLALLVLQGLGVESVPLQLLVCVIVSAAAQRHFVLLQGIL